MHQKTKNDETNDEKDKDAQRPRLTYVSTKASKSNTLSIIEMSFNEAQ